MPVISAPTTSFLPNTPVSYVLDTQPGLEQNIGAVALPDGGYILFWDAQDEGFGFSPGSRKEALSTIKFLIYGADGHPITDPVRADPETARWPADPAIALRDDSSFVVSWTERNYVEDPDRPDYWSFTDIGRMSYAFDAAGTALGEVEEEPPATPSTLLQRFGLTSGEYVEFETARVTESNYLGNPTNFSVANAQLFSGDSEPLGAEFRIARLQAFEFNALGLPLENGGFASVFTDFRYYTDHSSLTTSYNLDIFTRSFMPTSLFEGSDGEDTILGSSNNDTIVAGRGFDVVFAGPGDDAVEGGDGYNKLHGGLGDDRITGGSIRDEITGGDGADTIISGDGNDLAFGQSGDDFIMGGHGSDELHGQNGNDNIAGSGFGDLIFGGAGNDFVNGGFGHDRINGGTGADKFFHAGVEGHGSDWVQDYVAADGDVLLWGGVPATADDFQVNFAHTENDAGERAGDDAVQEAFVIYKPTGQIMWALVDGGGQDQINIQIGPDTFDLLA